MAEFCRLSFGIQKSAFTISGFDSYQFNIEH